MNRLVYFLLLVLGLTSIPILHADSLKDELNQHYKNKVLALRSPFVYGDQKFDSAGHPLSSPSGDWLVYGGIFVRDLSLSPKELRLKGPRVALIQTQGDEKPSAIPLGKDSIKVEISLDSPLNSIEEAEALLNRVFFLDKDGLLHAKPEYRRAGEEADGPIYKVGIGKDDVKPPKATYTPEPEFTDEARKSGFQGTVVLGVLVNKNGQVSRIRIEKPLGKGLDQQAVESVKTWRFNPATKDGESVAVEMKVEVSFQLYKHG
ncbi:MAG TPA: energy transducer TonB [Candidatus Angelobacter sp.]|nr:energy transducer TonB [Candidatus Angelobacter sp.]